MAAILVASSAQGVSWADGRNLNSHIPVAENRQVAAESRLGTLRDAATAAGIDTDAELQTLLMQEKAYTANARTLQVIDDLFRRLLEI